MSRGLVTGLSGCQIKRPHKPKVIKGEGAGQKFCSQGEKTAGGVACEQNSLNEISGRGLMKNGETTPAGRFTLIQREKEPD